MGSSALRRSLLVCGAALCAVGIALAFYADAPGSAYQFARWAENWCAWFVLAGLVLLLAGAVVWGFHTTVRRSLFAALGSAATGAFIAFFGRINVHGATAILLPVIFSAALATLLFIATALYRHFTLRYGRRGSILGLTPFLVAAIGVLVLFELQKPNAGPPQIIPAAQISRWLKALPQNAHFSLSGISFFNGKLYVATNLGIVEVSDATPARLFQFQRQRAYPVVSGPWLDRADHQLWATDDRTRELLRFDGNIWTRMQEPLPPKDYDARGKPLEGLRPAGNALGFWLACAGIAWKWNPALTQWDEVSTADPHANVDSGAVIGILPIVQNALLIVRHEPLPFLRNSDYQFLSDELVAAPDPASPPIERTDGPFLADLWEAAADAGYICTKDQKLLRVTTDRVSPLDSPGPCEALATDDDSNLLVSIRAKGIFRYAQEQWTLLAASPYPSGAGEYWTFLAASGSQLAVAIDAKPVIDPQHSSGADMRFTQNAPTLLWVLKDGKFVSVSF